MHDRISVHSVCFGDAGIDVLFAEWAALGARRVSFSSGQLFADDPARVGSLLAAGGHRAETITHVFHEGALDEATVGADREKLSRAIRVAQAIGARSIYLLTGGRGGRDWEAAADLFADAVAPCVAEARAAGIALAVENVTPFFAHGHIATNLRDTITLAERVGIGLCLDYFACWTESDMRAQIARAAPRLILVQASDYVLGDRATPCRAVPGDGAIPWPRVIGWLREAGYAGAYDLELLGPRIDAEGHRAAAARAAAALGAMLDAEG